MHLHLEIESRKGENVPKQKNSKQYNWKIKKLKKKWSWGNQKPNNGHQKIQK